jgi:hypothetical protein
MANRQMWLLSFAPKSWTGLAAAFLLVLAPGAFAQSSSDKDKDKTPEVKLEEPVMWGEYEVHSSTELGGRVTSFSGNQAIEETFVNQRDGFRVLDQSFDLRSPHHTGLLFDELHFDSFGFFGEPNTFSHFTLGKQKWYDFSASFRRDLNFWDYTLQANPLNPPTSVPAQVVTTSPHAFHTARNIQDYRLTIMPQSRFRVRLNYSNNFNNGPTFSSDHQGTDTLLVQTWRNRLDTYNVGFDFRFIPRTNISYDQFLNGFRGDTYYTDQNFGFQLSNGVPVDLGLVFDSVTVPASPTPCANPISNATTTPPTAKSTCSAFLAYNRAVPVRTLTPTEQLTFQSSYFKRVDLSGRFSYSEGEMGASNEFEQFAGLGRANLRGLFSTGPASAKRVSVNGDFGVTIDITKKVRFIDTFRWASFRIPGTWTRLELAAFSPNLLTAPIAYQFSATCNAVTQTSCPKHTSSSAADLTVQFVNHYLGQKGPTNTVEIEADINKYVGGSIGYRYRNREIDQRLFELAALSYFPNNAKRGACATGTPDPTTGICTVMTFNGTSAANLVNPGDVLEPDEDLIDITEHSLLLGFWLKPVTWWRNSFDMEILTADKTLTRIGPRNRDLFRYRTRMRPYKWLNVGGSLYWMEQRNGQADIANSQHNRNVSINAAITPKEKWSLDLSYGYTDVFSSIQICYIDYMGVAPKSTSTPCGTGAFLTGTSNYVNVGHYISGGFTLDPVKELHLAAGYTLNSYDGSNLLLNPNAPVGPLRSNYHLPNASIAYDFAKRWTARAAWNFYEYNEKGDPGTIPARDFRGNVFTMGMRYAF